MIASRFPKVRARAWFLIYRAGAALLGVMPIALATWIGETAGSLIYRYAPRSRLAIAANLRHVFGSDKDPAELERCVRASFRSYGRYWTELACLSRHTRKLDRVAFEIINYEEVREAVEAGQGVILALPHVGAWDIGGACLTRSGFKLTTVGEDATSEALSEFFVKRRDALGLDVLPLHHDTTRRLLDRARSGGILALLADRDIGGGGVTVRFFGDETAVPAGPAALALRADALLVPCAVYQLGRGAYQAVVYPPIDTERQGTFRQDVARLTQNLILAFESLILEAPEQWHVFQANWPESLQPAQHPVVDA